MYKRSSSPTRVPPIAANALLLALLLPRRAFGRSGLIAFLFAIISQIFRISPKKIIQQKVTKLKKLGGPDYTFSALQPRICCHASLVRTS
jgi:hypothetical protein